MRKLILVPLFCLGMTQAAFAQRVLPPGGEIGEIRQLQWPMLEINGVPYRLAPGADIRNQADRRILPMDLMAAAHVLYTVDDNGDVAKIWVLTPEEKVKLHFPAAEPGATSRPNFKLPTAR